MATLSRDVLVDFIKYHEIVKADYSTLKAENERLKSDCESDHASINELLLEFNRAGIETFNWDGDEGAEAAIVDGVVNHITELQSDNEAKDQRIAELEAALDAANKNSADALRNYLENVQRELLETASWELAMERFNEYISNTGVTG